MTLIRFGGALLALALSSSVLASPGHHGSSAIGEPGKAAQVTRTITISMSDNMRYTPSSLQVKQGETVRLIIRNEGKLKHEFSLGSEAELKEHYEVMKKYPDMEHDEPGKLNLAPGKDGEIIWRFSQAGTIHFACLHPGHYEAGMKGQVLVSKKGN